MNNGLTRLLRFGSKHPGLLATLISVVMIGGSAEVVRAQALNWEGQTGVFVTPLAYTAHSGSRAWGRPVVSYHYLNGGDVLGGFHQASITVGAINRVELGYTRTMHNTGSTASLSPLWSGGFNSFHGKANVIAENMAKQRWLPAVSLGFVARTQVRNVGGVLQSNDTSNADFYAVATKTITQIKKLPLVLTIGYKATNASLLGLAGNAPAYKGRVFGSLVAVASGPARSTLMFAAEALQQPRQVEGLPGAVVPTTITYAVRIVPSGAFPDRYGWGEEKPRFNIDLGVAQIAGEVTPGVNLEARHQFALGISYAF